MSSIVQSFLQARHFTRANRSRIDLIVMHAAEIGESLDGAEALMRGFAMPRYLTRNCPICGTNNKGAPICPQCFHPSKENKSSIHFNVDADSTTQSVHETDIANHAPGVNPISLGIELSGRSRQTPEEWDDVYSRTMLARAANLDAALAIRWAIPIVFVPAAGIIAKQRGITTHAEVAKAFPGKTNHTDPGPHFPMPRFIDQVKTYSLLDPSPATSFA